MKKNKLKGIITALKQEDCVLFIGSGISTWSGLPSWSGLLDELADYMEECGEDSSLVKREAANGDLLQAASYGFDRLTKLQIGDFMPRACRCGKAEPQEIHKKILDLGVKCFITTNYDKLIEMGIQKWRAKKPVMVVTNRQLAEMGRISQARATDFIYKPHGDVEDVESIILTREQYRSLLLNGERHMALETLKTLMVSRPVVYMGFGLRDPDFLYIRDILSNIYQGNVRDHYAVMADVEDAEADYWRRNYGIHLIGYETEAKPDGARSHAPLLELLETLNAELHASDKTDVGGKADAGQDKAETILAFIRYAARFAGYRRAETEFGIRVHRKSDRTEMRYADKYNGSLVKNFLMGVKKHAVLIGAPGAGKSYAMRQTAAEMAQKLNEKCLEESVSDGKSIDFCQMDVPIYIDLKLYDGNLERMIEKEFSKTLPPEMIRKECRCKIFLDSFNEMPKEYWDGGKYRQDFEKVFDQFGNAAVVIGARTSDGLEEYPFPVYYLDEIDRDTIDEELEKRGMTVKLNAVMLGIVSKPFYFQHIISGEIDIKNILQPKHFYNEFFGNLQKDFTARFSETAKIETILSKAAYRALDMGIEAFPVEFIYEGMDGQNVFGRTEEKEEAVNWLIYKAILIPYSNGKIAFVHQTVTEYLAAKELLCFYRKDKEVVREKIRFYRWDQTALFMVNLLSDDEVEDFIDDLFRIDFGLVLWAVQYMEFQRAEVEKKILRKIIESRGIRDRYRWGIDKYLRYDLQYSEENEENLRKVIEFGDSIGGSALFCLWRWKGDAIKEECMRLLLEHASDYNFCRNGAAEILGEIVEEEDLGALQKMVGEVRQFATIEEKEIEKGQGFICSMALILQKFGEESVRSILIGDSEIAKSPSIGEEIFCDYLRERKTAESLVMAMDLFMQGYQRAAMAVYFLVRFSKEAMPWDFFREEHIDRLLDCLDHGVWAFEALQEIVGSRGDLKDYVRWKANSHRGIAKAAMSVCIDPENQEDVFRELESLLSMEEDELGTQPFRLLKEIRLKWTGKEELFIRLLSLKNQELVAGLMGGSVPPGIKGFGTFEIENMDWWLNWIEELEKDGEEDRSRWQLLQISRFLAQSMDAKSRDRFLEKFNDADYPYRKMILRYIIPGLKASLDDFSEDTIQYILEDLKEITHWNGWEHHFLAYIADEPFIMERVVPLLESGDEILRGNAMDIIETAGAQQGKRYLLPQKRQGKTGARARKGKKRRRK